MAKMTKEQVKEFIERVEELIVIRNMTKAEFYEKAGYTDSAYSQWVTGQTTPSAKSINKTANALGVEATYLITGENKKSAPTVTDEGEEVINEIVEIMRTKSKEQQEAFLQLLRSNL